MKYKSTSLFLVLYIFFTALAVGETYHVVKYPKVIDKKCRNGIANIYDECSDQSKILKQALDKANNSGKSVLVVYGAEWCIWCHVFDKYVKGESRKYKYRWQYHDGENMAWEMFEKQNQNAEKEALALNKYVSENFVIAHIESFHSPNGRDVITGAGFDANKIKVVPFFMVLNSVGRYAGHMLPYSAIKNLEIRTDSGEDYRGFDRKVLLKELSKLRKESLKK